jgi:Zn-dependent M28 family amino/carboxypeptidase
MPREGPAPGADDNASGSAAVLVAADIMRNYQWACTLRFAFWTGEEQGFLGSSVYAEWAKAQGEEIKGYLNLDMLGYNQVPPHAMNLFWSSAITGSKPLADLFATVIAVYNLDLLPKKFDTLDYPLGNYSDNWSFWAQGYPAILVIEDSYDDFTPYYHRATDRLDTLDMDYFTAMVKASVGAFAHMTGCLLGRAERRVWLPLVSGAP